MRLYFHLDSDFGEIPDDEGLELEAIEDVRAHAVKALAEISKENPELFQHGRGWRMNVADESGTVLFSLALDRPDDGST